MCMCVIHVLCVRAGTLTAVVCFAGMAMFWAVDRATHPEPPVVLWRMLIEFIGFFIYLTTVLDHLNRSICATIESTDRSGIAKKAPGDEKQESDPANDPAADEATGGGKKKDL